jgi:alkylation response protein AidB-like acyl-CoA dehydrogenase
MMTWDAEHEQFRRTVRAFLSDRVVPHLPEWEQAGLIDRSLFTEAGKLGLLGFSVPEAYGGPGVDDFRYNAILVEETYRAGAGSVGVAFALQNDVVLPYLTDLATPEQQARWLPGVVTGETVLAIAMTEPDAGSDLAGIRTAALRDGEHYILNGSKTFISNGQNGDLFVVAVRTSPERHKGLSLLVVEARTPGFGKGRNLDKIGLHAQDTSELSFVYARVPVANLLGAEGDGFALMVRNLTQERLSLSVGALGAAEGVLAETVEYVQQRHAFGQPLAALQSTRMLLAELATELDAARTFVDDCLREHLSGQLTPDRAARLKWWVTELQLRVTDRCLQLHGGYGYMREYAVARAFVDARVQTIFGGATEVLKDLVGRNLLR